MTWRRLVASAALSLVSFATSFRLSAQTSVAQPQGKQTQATVSTALNNERDIEARKKALLDESSDLEEVAKSLTGTELDTALSLDRKASQGAVDLDAAYWFLAEYDHMTCSADRDVSKAVLNNRLGFYSYLLGIEEHQAAGQLAFARLPATAQAGERIKDDLQAAKNKLDELAISLK